VTTDPATNEGTIAAIHRATRRIIWAIVAGVLVIVFTLFYLRSQDPYWKCRSLNEGTIRDGDIDVWEDLNCNSILFPGE
jgi:hypothetical protein